MNYSGEFEKVFDLSEYSDNYLDTIHTVIVLDINSDIICFSSSCVYHISVSEKKVYRYDN
jgi:hypothetical protein